MEATELLTGILKERGASDDDPALWQLAQLCGGLPSRSGSPGTGWSAGPAGTPPTSPPG
ncbi:hypothetical protein ACFQ0B_40950 [Nonomuraea thailandensis]